MLDSGSTMTDIVMSSSILILFPPCSGQPTCPRVSLQITKMIIVVMTLASSLLCNCGSEAEQKRFGTTLTFLLKQQNGHRASSFLSLLEILESVAKDQPKH